MNPPANPCNKNIIKKDSVVIRFAGDSGDGIQLIGEQFSFTSALHGNDLVTFPDFPAEIRAPVGSPEGVSGYQTAIGSIEILTPGDYVDVLVALNPAALRSNLHYVKKGGNIIINSDSFDKKNITRAGFKENPLKESSFLQKYNVIQTPISSLTKTALKGIPINNKQSMQCKNMFALGVAYWLFGRSPHHTAVYLDEKFKKTPFIAVANKKALFTGYHFAETVEALPSTYEVPPAQHEKGRYRHISGSVATAWGLMAAMEKVKQKLFFGSYPITPASNILHELSRHKNLGVITFQAEDEIAAICSAIGAGYAGRLGATASSGPGIALKSEAIGLAVMAEIPLVIIDVQRGGPSTGLPTKTEQADMNLALYGRHGESPVVVLAATTPADCFMTAYMAAKLSIEHMTPVILLTDSYLANGSEPWKIPHTSELPPIVRSVAKLTNGTYEPYARDPEKLSRYHAVPGTPDMAHRIGGLEKQHITGHVSYDPQNHEKMVKLRAEKVQRVERYVPHLNPVKKSKLLVVGWGGTYGSLHTAVMMLQNGGHDIAHVHFRYINPLPENTESVLSAHDNIVVCELNQGQFASYLRSHFPRLNIHSYTQVQGRPFSIESLKRHFIKILRSQPA